MNGGVACLIVIYDCVGTYDGIGWHVWWWWWIVNLLVEFVVTPVSVSICSAQDIYYTYIRSIYVRLVMLLYFIVWWCHVGMDDFIHGWGQCNEHSWWCRVRIIIMYRPMGTIWMIIIPLHLPLLSQMMLLLYLLCLHGYFMCTVDGTTIVLAVVRSCCCRPTFPLPPLL